ncbi:MAG: Fis family transcriptional regulator [Gammaproteobacteria bacterium]|nr:Fis family transcriptional regulator [Gammaproteobacteria bacterium]|tara:strand:- start:255015 stop:255680 length:666 start_codon:yes stop_codon:yes gene_type:complete
MSEVTMAAETHDKLDASVKDKGKILVVEDDLALRKMLFNSLEMQGFIVNEADNRQSALDILQDNQEISVVILDLGLPPMEHTTDEGLNVIRQITDEMIPVKIIVLTGQDEERSALEAIREGAFDFLSKPASFEDILISVNRAFLFHHNELAMSADGVTRLQLSTKMSDGLKAVREEAEEKLVRQVLKETGFNIYQSAAKLGIKRESIYYFMKKFGISRDND